MSLVDRLEKAYYLYRQYIPSALLYNPQYFQVLDTLKAADSGVDITGKIAERLRYILTTCIEDVPYYRSTVKITAQDLKNEDPFRLLQEFPFLEKGTVMERQREFLNRRFKEASLNYATSGGSTGEGIGLWRNKRLADVEKAFFAHEWGKFGFSMHKSRYLRIGADARAQADQAPTRVMGNRLMLSPYHVNDRHKNAILDSLRTFRPQYVHAYPSVAADLAELLLPSDLGFQISGVLLASEPASSIQIRRIEKAFNCPISVNYGLTERTNIAFACGHSAADLHFQFNSLYGVNENRTMDGHQEIVGTSLWNDVTPLVRYCTKDFGAIDANGSCEAIQGRSQEFLIDKFGGRIPGLSVVIDEVTWDFVRLYQIRQEVAGLITIAVVPKSGTLTAEQKEFIIGAQQRRWGSFFNIELDVVSDIPLSKNGKRKLVVAGLK